MILYTVAEIVYSFTEKRKDVWIYAEGSTAPRTRLYQMAIANNIEMIEKEFIVLGFSETEMEPFQLNKNYTAFLVKRK